MSIRNYEIFSGEILVAVWNDNVLPVAHEMARSKNDRKESKENFEQIPQNTN